MGLSLSLLSWAWFEGLKSKILGSNGVRAMGRSLSFSEKEVKKVMRSLSFKRSYSGSKMAPPSLDEAVLQRQLSFQSWKTAETELECADSPARTIADSIKAEPVSPGSMDSDAASQMKLQKSLPPGFSSPRPRCELDAAALKLQKVYKSYRTRRNLADCAVVVEELWWKALDFASLKQSSISFFHSDKHESAASRWARASKRAAKVGKGLSKDDKAQKLALQHWLEAIDPRHRYGHNLHLYYDIWFESESTEPFFYWLDVGAGREVNIEKCPRSKLQQQCIKYLGPIEREAYQVIAEDGKLVYKQSGALLHTTPGSKWIFVLSTSRSLYVGKKEKGTFQHSSFLSGGATTAAGRLVSEEGVLKAIWPYSGHYLPTEENFREFINFLEENNIDMTDVKRCSVDDDQYPSFHKEEVDTTVLEPAKAPEVLKPREASDEAAAAQPNDVVKDNMDKAPPDFELGRRLSCKWSTGAGPRIGCVRDYPADLQCRALEHVNLSPRFAPTPKANKAPIPSPRPSPGVRLSPRLAYIGTIAITPKPLRLTLPQSKRIVA